ncbi:MAG: hypothetical protein ACREQZ_07240, partial [Woeseiaceae bacterium]
MKAFRVPQATLETLLGAALVVCAAGGLLLSPHAVTAQNLPGIRTQSLVPDVLGGWSGLIGPQSHDDDLAPNDTLFTLQWGPQQVRTEQAWHVTRGAGAVIAIVDSGIDLDHPDL